MSEDVALAVREPKVVTSNGDAPPPPCASVPQTSTPPAFAFTSQEPAERFATTRDVEVAFPNTAPVAKRFVLVAFVEVEKLVKRFAMVEEPERRLVRVARPVFDTEKSVDVALPVEDAIKNALL